MMTKSHSLALGAVALLLGLWAGGYLTPASAHYDHSRCKRGATVTFMAKVKLTQNDRVVCTVPKGGRGTARALGAHHRSCLIEYWGRCQINDRGWAPLTSFRRGL